MISANDFKNGLVIQWNGHMFQIVSFQHVKMQQRAPIIRTKMINLKSGAFTEQAFRSNDKFEEAYLERRDIQYLYQDDQLLHFMDNSDYQDVVISVKMVQDKMKFIKDNAIVQGLYCNGELLTIELPASVVLKVTETEPGIKGDTAKSGTKPATLETGFTAKVPLFINSDDLIKIDTRTGDYLERA